MTKEEIIELHNNNCISTANAARAMSVFYIKQYSEIARLLNTSKQAVQQAIKRGQPKLKYGKLKLAVFDERAS